MTAEIAILNKSAIAVAADSAVTRGSNKVHVTANKIFRLSETIPLGLMVYGNADVFRLPWELVAKLFRKEFGSQNFRTVKDACDKFCEFLSSDLFLKKGPDDLELITICFDVAEKIRSNAGGKNRTEFCQSIKKEIDKFSESLYDNLDFIEDYKIIQSDQFKKDHGEACKKALREVFDNIDLTKDCQKKFPDLVYLAIRKKYLSDYMSGFVLFGYGEDEILPALHIHFVDGAPLGEPRIWPEEPTKIQTDPKKGASIVALANAEITNLFMENISRPIQRYLTSVMNTALKKFGDNIFKEFTDAGKITKHEQKVYKKLFSDQVDEFSEAYENELQGYIQGSSINPVVSAIDGLSKDDMANLAESLVELTSLRLRVSRQVEVVGGPVDVAVLSKVDGFIWIKRKHYFDPKYNAHFFENYGAAEKPIAGE